MNRTTIYTIIFTILLVLGVGFHQYYGVYSLRQCAEITELMGSDFHQCYSGNIGGIVGLDLHVNPIAYKILRNKHILLKHIERWQRRAVSEELHGAIGYKSKFHNIISDEKISAIAREVYEYLPSQEKDNQELQEYSPQRFKAEKKVIKIQDYKESN